MLLVEVARVVVVVVRVVERVVVLGLVGLVLVVLVGLVGLVVLVLAGVGFEPPADAGKVPPLAESPLAVHDFPHTRLNVWCEQVEEGQVGNICERHVHCFDCMETRFKIPILLEKTSILKNLWQNVKICEEDWQKKDFRKIFGKT